MMESPGHFEENKTPLQSVELVADKNSGAKWRIWLTWMLREFTGVVFTFSGFVKAVDPWGTLYKIQDYLGVMGLDISYNIVLVGVFLLCSIEFMVGIGFIFGNFRRTTAISCFAIICFMLPLTLWIAIFNPVSDCGCFGEALIIGNWETFWKNVVLIMAAAWLLKYNKRARCLIAPPLQWIAFVTSAVFIVIIEVIGYNYQPLLDFRNYKIGSTLIDNSHLDSDDAEYEFLYSHNGITKIFGEDDELPDDDSGWSFVGRREKESSASDGIAHKNLRIWDIDTGEDITDSVFSVKGDRLIFFMPELSKVSIATTWKINALYKWAEDNKIDVMAIVAGNSTERDEWKDISLADYPIYGADDTQIKEVVRGNPSLIFLHDGVITWKNSLRAVAVDDKDNIDLFKTNVTEEDRTSVYILENLAGIYIAVMSVLVMFSFVPMLSRLITRGGRVHRVK